MPRQTDYNAADHIEQTADAVGAQEGNLLLFQTEQVQ